MNIEMQARTPTPRSAQAASLRKRPKAQPALAKLPVPRKHKQPHVAIVGDKRVARAVKRALEREEIAATIHPTLAVAEHASTATTRALIVVPPLPNEALIPACKRAVSALADVPVFVTCGPSSDTTLKKLYGVGVEGVFLWPGDRSPLLRTMFRIVRAPMQLGRPKKASSPQEVALEELVRAHLQTEKSTLGGTLQVRAKGHYIMLSGHVDALWQVHVAELIASEVPGVDEVFADAVLVLGGEDLSDRGIANAARQVLKHTTGVDASTLAVSVKQGKATLAGSAANRRELMRAVDLIAHVRGIRGVEHWAVITDRGKRKDHVLANNLQTALALRFSKLYLDVSVFDGVAVLSGKVKSASQRRELEALAYRQQGISRVVDKLIVSKSSAPKQNAKSPVN